MRRLLFLLVIIVISEQCLSQERTVGVTFYSPAVSEGYTLITSHHSTSSYLINNCGEVVHEWKSAYNYGNSVDLLENGLLLRATRDQITPGFGAGGSGGRVELLNWEGEIVWELSYANNQHRQHHDALYLPNGNILLLAWDLRDKEEALQAGLNPAYLGTISEDIWSEHLIEVKPLPDNGYEIVWEWYLWDHLIQEFDNSRENYGVVSEHPELVNLNYNTDPGNPDWIHANAIAYNADLDQVILNSRNFNEFWIIDHSTSSEEARGHTGGNSGRGGDLLYRYGNPAVYNRGTEADQRLFSQHNTHWIARDKILIFNNGRGREPAFSEIFFMETPLNENGTYRLDGTIYGPASPYKTYSSEQIDGFVFSPFISSVELLNDNRLLICSGASGMVSEVSETGETLWTYINPLSSEGTVQQGTDIINTNGLNNLMYRSRKYSVNYSGLVGELIPRGPIELNPLASLCAQVVGVDEQEVPAILYPNPSNGSISLLDNSNTETISLQIYSQSGKLVKSVKDYRMGSDLDIRELPSGLYILQYPLQGAMRQIRLIQK